jgi:hypothetical protein
MLGTLLGIGLSGASWYGLQSEMSSAQDFAVNTLLAPLPLAASYMLMTSLQGYLWGQNVDPMIRGGGLTEDRVTAGTVGFMALPWLASSIGAGIGSEFIRQTMLSDSPYASTGDAVSAGALFGAGFGLAHGVLSPLAQAIGLRTSGKSFDVQHAFMLSFCNDPINLLAIGHPYWQEFVFGPRYARTYALRSLLSRGLPSAFVESAAFVGAQASFGRHGLGVGATAAYYFGRAGGATILSALTGAGAQSLRTWRWRHVGALPGMLYQWAVDFGVRMATGIGPAILRVFNLR